MPRHHGIHHFKKGASKLSCSTGREAKEMMKVFLPVAADGGPRVAAATRALLKFMYLAHSSTLTGADCDLDESWDDYGNGEVADEMEGKASNEEEMEDLETASNDYLGSDGFEEEETEDEDDGNSNDLASGFIAERLVQTERGVTGKSQGSTANQPEPMLYYLNPTVVTAATRKPPVTLQYLIATHSATNIGRDISLFLKKLHPTIPLITLLPNTELRIWTIACLFHAPLPFKPLDPPKVDHVQARPATINNIQQIRRVEQYDTVLVLAYPNKTGIHRYHAARVHAIFELLNRFEHLFTHKLVYVEWFNPFSPTPIKYLEAYTTTKSFDQARRAQTAVVPLSTVQLTCHLGPQFNTIDKEVQLTPYTDTFAVCRSFILNQFSSYYCFDLLEHWITFTSLLE
ncbi:hypothetical protein RSOL_557450, partial [Rhizoctonia solani AG-3 Rhs1AP]